MTPLYNKLTRFLPPAMSCFIMVIVYAALLILIVTFLSSRGQIDLIYLDLGR
jgi:hypothetical protein